MARLILMKQSVMCYRNKAKYIFLVQNLKSGSVSGVFVVVAEGRDTYLRVS